jgi:hypothetical protein
MRSKGDPNHCAIAAYHGSWERPNNGSADIVLATAKEDAADFEMPAGTGNDTGEVSSSGHPTYAGEAPSPTPHDDERARQNSLFPIMVKPRQLAERASRKRPDCRWRTEKRRSNGPSDNSHSAARRQRACAAFVQQSARNRMTKLRRRASMNARDWRLWDTDRTMAR